MPNSQESFPYLPNMHFGIRNRNQREINQMALINRNRSENDDQFIQSISQQSLDSKQWEINKKRKFENSVKELTNFYQVSNSNNVKQFLLNNQFLFPILKEIPQKIYQYFGENQKMSLKMSYDPDFPQSSELWVLVLTELSAKEARSIMNKFDKEWWLKNLYKTDYKLNIGIEYV